MSDKITEKEFVAGARDVTVSLHLPDGLVQLTAPARVTAGGAFEWVGSKDIFVQVGGHWLLCRASVRIKRRGT